MSTTELVEVLRGTRDYLVIAGEARAAMAALPEHSISMAVNSPPYFRQRYYGCPPVVWGGVDDCDHTWEADMMPPRTGGTTTSKLRIKGAENFQLVPAVPFSRCHACGAWRGELGHETTVAEYVEHLAELYAPLQRVLHPTATFWLNIGDCYNGSGKGPTGVTGIGNQAERQGFVANPTDDPEYKPKDLMGIPWRLARRLQEQGWWVRSISPWVKRNALGSSAEDKPANFLEWIIQLTPRRRYYFDMDAVLQPAKTQDQARFLRNTDGYFAALEAEIAYLTALRDQGGLRLDGNGKPLSFDYLTARYRGDHFAAFPETMIATLVRASTSAMGVCVRCRAPQIRQVEKTHVTNYTQRDTIGWKPSCACGERFSPAVVLDPTAGISSAGRAALQEGRRYVGVELKASYAHDGSARLATHAAGRMARAE